MSRNSGEPRSVADLLKPWQAEGDDLFVAYRAAVVAVADAVRPFSSSNNSAAERRALGVTFIRSYAEWTERQAQEATEQKEGTAPAPEAFIAVRALERAHAELFRQNRSTLDDHSIALTVEADVVDIAAEAIWSVPETQK